MEFNDYQQQATRTAVGVYSEKEIMFIIYPLLGLSGEIGELTDKIKKILRNNNFHTSEEVLYFLSTNEEIKISLIKEIGDILWYLSEFSRRIDVEFNLVAETNLTKLFDRLNRNMIKSEGDNR